MAPFSLGNFIVGIGANTSSTPFVVNGSISGNSDVVLGSNTQYGGLGTSSGTLVLAGTNTYTGTTIMAGNGVIQMGSSAALPSTTDVIFGVTATGSSTSLDLNGYSQQIDSLSANTNGSAFSITNNGLQLATLTISGSTTPLTKAFGGTIRDGSSPIAIAKNGTGLLALAGSNTYSGGTTINGGTLLVSHTGATGTALVTVGSGGVLAPSTGVTTLNSPVGVSAGGALLSPGFQTGSGTLNILGGLTLAASSSVNFDYGQSPSARNAVFAGSGLNLSGGSGSVAVNFTLDPNAVMQGVIPLFSWSGTGTSTFTPAASQLYLASINGSLPSGGSSTTQYSFLLDNNPSVTALTGGAGNSHQIDLYDPNLPVAQALKWATSGGAWASNVPSNAFWSGSSLRNYYVDNDNVTFADNLPTTSGTVTIASGGVQPQTLAISNTATAYTFTGGPVVGYTSLVKTGSGVATLAASNSYFGGTTITGGTLVAAGDSSLGDPSGAVQLDSKATLMAGAAGLTSSRTLNIGSGGNGTGGTFFNSGSTCTLNGAVNITGTFSKAGTGFLTLANTQFNQTAASMLNVASGTVQMIDNVNFSNSGSLTIQSGATAMLDNSNGSLGVYTTANGGGFSANVAFENGASIKGNLVLPAAMHLNFDAGTFSGAGQIQVQSRSMLNVLTNSTKANSTIGVNIHLNSLGDSSPFTKYDVSTANGNLQPTSSAACSIAGGGAVASAAGNGVLLTVSGIISGNSDLNVANDGGLGGDKADWC